MPLLQRWDETILLYPYKIDIVHERYSYGDAGPHELVSVATLARCMNAGTAHTNHVYASTWVGQPHVKTRHARQPLSPQDGLTACEQARTQARAMVMREIRTMIGE